MAPFNTNHRGPSSDSAIGSTALMKKGFFAAGTATFTRNRQSATTSNNKSGKQRDKEHLPIDSADTSTNASKKATGAPDNKALSIGNSLHQFCQQMKFMSELIKSNIIKLDNIPRFSKQNGSTTTVSSAPSAPDDVMMFKKAIAVLSPEKQLDLFRKLMDVECKSNNSNNEAGDAYHAEQFISKWLVTNTIFKRYPYLHDLLDKGDTVFYKTFIYEAQKALKKLATSRQGVFESEAQYLLANCYGIGALGVPVSAEKAFALYLLASKQNHSEATYRAGVCYELGIGTKKSYRHAVRFYRKAATKSHASSMFKLAIIFMKGYCDQPVNLQEAFVWLQRAALIAKHSFQNPEALHVLALTQLSTKECSKMNSVTDVRYALELLELSAKAGYIPSQLKLGELHEVGTSAVEINDALSIYWYTQAAQRGSIDGALALSTWYLTGSQNVLQQSDRNAYLWARKAAAYQDSERWSMAKANYAVGMYMKEGVGVRIEIINEFTAWFKRAAALGHLNAIEILNETELV